MDTPLPFFYKDSIRRFWDKLLENLKSCIYTYIVFNVQFNQSALGLGLELQVQKHSACIGF